MDLWAGVWNKLAAMHSTGDLWVLVPFYGTIIALIVFVCLQVMLVRGRRLALKAGQAARDLQEDVKALQAQMDDVDRRLEKRLDLRAGDLDARMTRKIDQKGDLIQERLEQHRTALTQSVAQLEARVARLVEQLAVFGERVEEVEDRIPNLFDRLDEFRETLARTFQAELGGVLSSFDNSVAAILQQMKAELQLGISRIESIEGMVQSRTKAERSLLGTPPDELALPGDAFEAEEAEFEEWEREAKELAKAEELGEAEELDEEADGELLEPPAEEPEPGAVELSVEAAGPAPPEVPDDLESELYMGPADEPDGEAPEGGPEEDR